MDRVNLYRHHRCLQALQRGIPQAGQDFSGVPRTHQFLVTLTVHTNKINPATTPTATSAASTKNGHPVVVVQRDGQHEGSMPLNRMRQRELSQDAIWPLQANSPPASHH